MKGIKLIHPSYCREVLSEDDAARLRQAGWLELDEARPVSKAAANQRRYRDRCKKNGLRLLAVWLPLDVYAALSAERRPQESIPEQIERILKQLSLL
ncbi:MAG: hypothetical protein ACI9UK_000669 [Candidatus Krumholzibacteriia bacterium]|jgi:hypothetical protein